MGKFHWLASPRVEASRSAEVSLSITLYALLLLPKCLFKNVPTLLYVQVPSY